MKLTIHAAEFNPDRARASLNEWWRHRYRENLPDNWRFTSMVLHEPAWWVVQLEWKEKGTRDAVH